MNILNLKSYLIIGAMTLIVGSLITGITVWNIRGTQIDLLVADHEKTLLESKLVAESAQKDLLRFQLDFETNLGSKKDELQTHFEKSFAAINKSVADLSKYRLQDPHANRGTGASSNTGSAGSGDGSDPGRGVLSEEASQFLFAFAAESDIILERLRTCKAWDEAKDTEYNKYRNRVESMIMDLKEKGYVK